MKFNRIIAGVVMAGAAAAVSAQTADATEHTTISKVETVYVRVGHGLYFEKKLLRNTVSNDLWVDVRSATSLPGAPDGGLFQVPPDITIERGDLITTRDGDPTPVSMKLLPEESKVTQLVAKHDTLMALAFGRDNAQRAQSVFVNAQAWPAATSTFAAYAGTYTR